MPSSLSPSISIRPHFLILSSWFLYPNHAPPRHSPLPPCAVNGPPLTQCMLVQRTRNPFFSSLHSFFATLIALSLPFKKGPRSISYNLTSVRPARESRVLNEQLLLLVSLPGAPQTPPIPLQTSLWITQITLRPSMSLLLLFLCAIRTAITLLLIFWPPPRTLAFPPLSFHLASRYGDA